MVLLDTGLGFDTAGKRSPEWKDGTQLFEWEFNRDVVRRIESKLIVKSIPYKILVREARDVKLSLRADRANAIYAENKKAFLISVHGNAGGGQGWEVWTSPGQTESDKIATLIYNEARVLLPDFKMRTDMSDGDVDKESEFYILTKTKCPAVLTENLFYDNEKECKFMMTNYGREIIARIHYYAILTYLNLRQ
jgi:N-acetylmuramoyl-L-alanine amidase